MKRYFLIGSLLLMTSAQAEVTPESVVTDNHIQVATYNSNQVYRVRTLQGYITSVQFSPEEKILSVNIGDSSSWLVSVQNEMINLKPIADHPDTNLNVLTSRGTYQFFLTAPSPSSNNLTRRPAKDTAFLVRFRYPQEVPVNAIFQPKPRIKNWKYTARGDSATTPLSVFDDSRFTYFDFGSRKDVPAIFTVDAKGNESVVNYHLQGKNVVVETTAKQFTLRNGNQVATVFNEAAQ